MEKGSFIPSWSFGINISLIELEEQEGLRVCSNVLNIAPEDIYVNMPVQVTFMPTVDEPNVVLPLFVPSK